MGAARTVTIAGALAEGSASAVPEYNAVNAWVPGSSATLGVQAAVDAATGTASHPATRVGLSKNATVPPSTIGTMVAVSETAWP